MITHRKFHHDRKTAKQFVKLKLCIKIRDILEKAKERKFLKEANSAKEPKKKVGH